MVEIRWHGRGGQGAKTASKLLALAQMAGGLWVQAFPEYGPERSGAPMVAYNRADTAVIRRHDQVRHPVLVVVLDASLWNEVNPLAGLPPGGRVLVNTAAALSGARDAARVTAVPGDRLAQAAGTRFANVVMVGAALAALGQGDEEALGQAVQSLFARMGETTVLSNARAARAGYRFVRAKEAAS